MSQPQTKSTEHADAFSGEETFDVPAARLFAALTDLDPEGPLARSIPDLVSAQRVDDAGGDGRPTLACKVKPGFSFMRATMKLTVELVDVDAPERAAAMRIASSGIGASMAVECRMRVTEVEGDERSRVDWAARVLERKGLLAAVSPTLIRGAADKVVRDGWDALRRNLND